MRFSALPYCGLFNYRMFYGQWYAKFDGYIKF